MIFFIILTLPFEYSFASVLFYHKAFTLSRGFHLVAGSIPKGRGKGAMVKGWCFLPLKTRKALDLQGLQRNSLYNHAEGVYIINSEGIAYHQHVVLYIIKPQENTRWRVMRYNNGSAVVGDIHRTSRGDDMPSLWLG